MSWTPLEKLLLADDAPAVVPESPRRRLIERALRLAGGLQAAGARRIAVHLENADDLAVALLAAWRAGVVPIMPADLSAESRRGLHPQVDLWLTDLPDDTRLAALEAEPLPAAALDLGGARLVLSTSGSTGAPKHIDKALYQLANEVSALEQLWGQELMDTRVVASVSAQHIYGLLFRVLWPLCAGRPFVRQAQPYPEYLQQESLADANWPFLWVTSPALLKRLGDNLDWPRLAAVRRIFSSGGQLPAEVAEAVRKRLGQLPTEVYGSSETGGIAWRQGDTPWKPFDDVQLVATADGAFDIGSPYLPEGQRERCADGLRMLADGRFELTGRLDRIIKLEEKRISLPQLEGALTQSDWVDEVRLGVIEERRAYLGAVVALSPAGLQTLRDEGRQAVIAALRAQLSAHCEPIALPRRWRFLLQLPANAQGKTTQADIDRLLQADKPRRPELLEDTRDGDEWRLELQLPPDLAFFTGHFATTPVLPGVVQVDWALAFARERLSLPPRFLGMEVLKFQQLARPGDRLSLRLRFDDERSKLHFGYTLGSTPCSSGRLLLGEADA